MALSEFNPVYDIPPYGYTAINSVLHERIYPTCTLKICSFFIPTNSELNNPKNKAIKRGASFKDLQNGWDGYNAKATNEKVIESAIEIIRKLPFCPEAFPTSEGNIQLQFEDSDGNYMEMEVLEDSVVEIYLEMTGQETKEFSVSIGDVDEWKKVEKLARMFKKEISLNTNCLQVNSIQMKSYSEQFQCVIQ